MHQHERQKETLIDDMIVRFVHVLVVRVPECKKVRQPRYKSALTKPIRVHILQLIAKAKNRGL